MEEKEIIKIIENEIVEEKKANQEDDNKIYLLRLKPEYNKEIENIKEEINKGELNKNGRK